MTTTQTSRDAAPPEVPEWDLADRMTKSLRSSGVGVTEMADMLGVGRDTISRWINGKNAPKRAALLAWAPITNVDMHWLETGHGTLCACRDSNPKPSDLYLVPPLGRILGTPRPVNPTLTPNRPGVNQPTRHLRAVS